MIKLTFKYDDQLLADSLKRYQRQHSVRQVWGFFKIVLIMLFIALASSSAAHGDTKLVFFFAAVVLIMLFGHRLDYLLIGFQNRKSPHINEQVEISICDDGIRTVSQKAEFNAKWTAFTKAVAFRDGFLLFQGPRVFSWLPSSQIVEGTVSQLTDLIEKNINVYKVIEPQHQPDEK